MSNVSYDEPTREEKRKYDHKRRNVVYKIEIWRRGYRRCEEERSISGYRAD
jgi:hypothetical protein